MPHAPAAPYDAAQLAELLRTRAAAQGFAVLAPEVQQAIVARVAACSAAEQEALLARLPSLSGAELAALGEGPLTAARPRSGPGADATQVTVAAGDSLSRIARRHHTSVARLVEANPDICDPDLIYPGQVIVVPAA